MGRNWALRAIAGTAVIAAVVLSPPLARSEDKSAAMYKQKCAACHGADGKGETPMGKANKLRDFGSADVQKQTDSELTTIIENGKGKMPAYGKSLNPDQVKGLVVYIRSLAKK